MAFAAGTSDPASSDLGKLWAEVFSEITIEGQGTYQAPRAVISYRAGDLPATSCAPAGTEQRWRENAAYCDGDDVIVYDEDWFRAVSEEFSYFAPVTILAHEWGHHVQSVVGRAELDIQVELEADCLSGLYATASGFLPRDGDDRSTELDAMELALRTWFNLGDERYAESEWFDVGVHGSSQQRMMAFMTGATSNVGYLESTPSMTGGIPWCYGYRDFRAGSYTELGGEYRLLNLPGRAGAWAGSVFSIPPETRTSVETSAIALTWIPDLPLDGGATEAQLEELWRRGFPNLKNLAPVPISGSAGGTAVASYFETTAPGSPPTVESGIFALVSPADAVGGLLILVYRPEAAPLDAKTPEEVDVLEEELAALHQVLGRLCSPDESGEAGASNLDVVCMRELQ